MVRLRPASGPSADLVLVMERPDTSGRVEKNRVFLLPPGITEDDAENYRKFRETNHKGTDPEEALDIFQRLIASP